MNHKQKLAYMALGAGIMAVGITIGQFITPNIEAQSNGVFDEITCRRLKVVDKLGRDAISLNAGEKSNGMTIFDKTQAPAILLVGGFVRDEAKDNLIQIYGRAENNGILLIADETSSLVKLFDSAGNSAIFLGAHEEEGNSAAILDKVGNIRWSAP